MHTRPVSRVNLYEFVDLEEKCEGPCAPRFPPAYPAGKKKAEKSLCVISISYSPFKRLLPLREISRSHTQVLCSIFSVKRVDMRAACFLCSAAESQSWLLWTECLGSTRFRNNVFSILQRSPTFNCLTLQRCALQPPLWPFCHSVLAYATPSLP